MWKLIVTNHIFLMYVTDCTFLNKILWIFDTQHTIGANLLPYRTQYLHQFKKSRLRLWKGEMLIVVWKYVSENDTFEYVIKKTWNKFSFFHIALQVSSFISFLVVKTMATIARSVSYLLPLLQIKWLTFWKSDSKLQPTTACCLMGIHFKFCDLMWCNARNRLKDRLAECVGSLFLLCMNRYCSNR